VYAQSRQNEAIGPSNSTESGIYAPHLLLQLATWAFCVHVGLQVQFPPKTRCDWWGAEKRHFEPQPSLDRAYTPPMGSDGADHLLDLAVRNPGFPNNCESTGLIEKLLIRPVESKKLRFDPQTILNRVHTPPTCSDGADHWYILHLATWVF